MIFVLVFLIDAGFVYNVIKEQNFCNHYYFDRRILLQFKENKTSMIKVPLGEKFFSFHFIAFSPYVNRFENLRAK